MNVYIRIKGVGVISLFNYSFFIQKKLRFYCWCISKHVDLSEYFLLDCVRDSFESVSYKIINNFLTYFQLIAFETEGYMTGLLKINYVEAIEKKRTIVLLLNA